MKDSRNLMQPDGGRVAADALKEARASVKRLPVTMRPTLNQQLHNWQNLFAYERRRLQEFVSGIENFQAEEWAALTQPLLALERQMGVAHWPFNTEQDTMENASLLARSADYTTWRAAVQKLFASIEAKAAGLRKPAVARPRLLLLDLPQALPVPDPAQWRPWSQQAISVKVEGGANGLADRIVQALPDWLAHKHSPDLKSAEQNEGIDRSSDLWLIDAAASLPTLPAEAAAQLQFGSMAGFRDRFLAEVNTMPKNIAVSDQTLSSVRNQPWEKWVPPDLKAQPRLRSFMVDLFLSGNGAMIYPSAFVEWASCEAMRRARPTALVARFGLRAKPKPFTGIAIFENQQQISNLPEVADAEGSATDALQLARYVWLAANRYAENAPMACLCIAQKAGAVYWIEPGERIPEKKRKEARATAEEVEGWVRDFLGS